MLMGVLRKGQAWFESNYRSAQEIAQKDFLKRKKAEKERLKKLEEETFELACADWQEQLSPEELEKIAPKKKGRGDIMPQSVKLSLYFRENLWPEKKKEYMVSG